MEIMISKEAIDFFKTEMNVPQDKGVRIKGKTYGYTNVHTYFSVAIEVATPQDPIAMLEEDNLKIFVERSDEWFVKGLNLEIDYDAEEGIPTYYFLADDNRVLDNSNYQRNYPSQHLR